MADYGGVLGGTAGQGQALQDILQQRFREALANQQAQQEQQRIAIEQQRVNNESDLKKLALQQALDEHKASQQVATQKADEGYMGMVSPGADLGPSGSPAMAHAAGAGMTGPQFVKNVAPTLSSENITGAAQAGPASQAPKIIGLAATQNPGAPEKNIFQGTYAQKNQQQVHADALSATETAREDRASRDQTAREDRAARDAEAAANRENMLRLGASLRQGPQPQMFIGLDGKPRAVQFSGGKATEIPLPEDVASKTPPKGIGAVTENRLQSARAVVQTGNDIIQQLSNPATADALGKAMSRVSNAADFFGSAPPEWNKLAGQIESYSLANMGVHGMRANSGAEAIKQTIGQGRHTPQSIIAAIQGLNGFANHLMENNKVTVESPGGPATGGGGDVIRVQGPNGKTGTVPKGTALPDGWKVIGG